MKTKIFLFVIALILCIAACNKSNSPVSPTANDVLIPLKVGNTWIYEIKLYDEPNNPKTEIDTLSISKDTILNGETWYLSLTKESCIPYINRKDGFYTMFPDSSNDIKITLMFKYPADVYDKWNNGDSLILENFTLLSKNDTITVGAGNFVCYKYQYEFNYPEISFYKKNLYWICPGKGIIKTEEWERFDTNNLSLNQSSELLRYELK